MSNGHCLTLRDDVEKLLQELKTGLDRIALFLYGSDRRPRALWHYTSAEGLRGIISTSKLRFSHVRFLNDPTEGVFGWSTARRLLNEGFADVPELQATLAAANAYGDEFHYNVQYFVFCLSARPDSLSQWRAYGRGGAGYALCFSFDELLYCTGVDPSDYDSAGSVLPRPCFLLRMLYEDFEQRNALGIGAYTMLEFMERLRATQTSTDVHAAAMQRANGLFADYLMRTAISFKDPSFSDESEWRLVVGVPTDGAAEVLFRADGDIIKPFVELALESSVGQLLPITRVMLGPTLKPASSRGALEFFLRRAGYDAVIDGSIVPLQA